MATTTPIITFPVNVYAETPQNEYLISTQRRIVYLGRVYEQNYAEYLGNEEQAIKCYTNPGDTHITVSPDKKVLQVLMRSAVFQTPDNPSGTPCTGYMTIIKLGGNQYHYDWKALKLNGQSLSQSSGVIESSPEHPIDF